MRQNAHVSVALVEHPNTRGLLCAELIYEQVNDSRLLLPIGVADIYNMQQHIGVGKLLKRCLERLDQVVRQLADKADCVGDKNLRELVDAQLAGRGVERVEKAVVCRNVGVCKAV